MNNKTYLAFGLALTLVLSGCKATVDLSDESDTSASLPNNNFNHEWVPPEPPQPEANNPFPEPKGNEYDPPSNDLGFYDYDRQGKPRVLINHLSGELAANIQFGQNLTTAANGNEENWHPRPVAEREALLIVIPTEQMGSIHSLQLLATVNGEAKPLLQLDPPNLQPQADVTTLGNRPNVVFSSRAWTTHLPYDWMVPGLALTLVDSENRQGYLSANEIDFAAPGELTINQIQLGLITDYPDAQYMLTDTAAAATDYFQTIPAAQITVGKYDPMRLDKVMVGTGQIYTPEQLSETIGSVYAGDMREDVAKATFSTGINLANWGITSAALYSQHQPQLTQRAVMHHARGQYAEGAPANHGLSGGNGILTLLSSSGNEFSHEIGHHYGLGHFPGGEIDKPHTEFWDRHHADSGWGYIGYRKRMHSNINWNGTPSAEHANLKGIYAYGTDSMSGGHDSSSLSRYVLYTGYSTYLKIQPAFDKVQYSCDLDTNTVTGTGFVQWNKDTRAMEPVQPKLPASNFFWHNQGDGQGNYLKPRLCSVPVFTLLGGYDPDTEIALMYPAARSNLGNVFNLPEVTSSTTERRCWVQVDFANNASKKIAIAAQRMQKDKVNRYHINLAQSDRPTQAAVYCQEPSAQPQQLGEAISIPDASSLPPMEPAVVVGKEQGYQRLWEVESVEFKTLLDELNNKPVPLLDSRGQLLYHSWGDSQREHLSFSQQSQLTRYERLDNNITRLNRWLFAWRPKLQEQDPAAEAHLLDLLKELELQEGSSLLPTPSEMLVGNESCLSLNLDTLDVRSYGRKEAICTDPSKAAQRSWIVDAFGRIHNGADLSLCINATSPISVSECSLNNEGQVWDFSNLPSIRKADVNRCLDMNHGALGDTGEKEIVLYFCVGTTNQRWSQVAIDEKSALLPLLHPRNYSLLQSLDARAAAAATVQP